MKNALLPSLAVITVLVLSTALLSEQSLRADMNGRMSDLIEIAQRSYIEDALVGSEMPPLTLLSSQGESVTISTWNGPTLVWIINPDLCVDCLHNIAAWNNFGLEHGVDRLVAMIGSDSDRLFRLARTANIVGEVLVDTASAVAGTLGIDHGSAHLLVDQNGELVLVDIRSRIADCVVSAPEAVERLFRMGAGYVN